MQRSKAEREILINYRKKYGNISTAILSLHRKLRLIKQQVGVTNG
jgi:hypothetical protein